MAEVTNVAEQETSQSDFLKYIQNTPEMSQHLMSILSNLYTRPMKVSQVQTYLQEMFNITIQDPSIADEIREENLELYDRIFDLQDQADKLEKELEEAKEENEGI